MSELIYKDESYAIVGAAMAVHRALGLGFTEKVYQEALAIELAVQGIPFEREKPLCVTYRGQQLKQMFYADFVCYGKIIVELKAVSNILPEHQLQVTNYLRCADMKLGLILNFGKSSLDVQRVVW